METQNENVAPSAGTFGSGLAWLGWAEQKKLKEQTR